MKCNTYAHTQAPTRIPHDTHTDKYTKNLIKITDKT